jgi:hypothetical protein
MTTRCAWPEGDPLQPGFRFCGEPVTQQECPYCAAHAAKAYRGHAVRPVLRKSALRPGRAARRPLREGLSR